MDDLISRQATLDVVEKMYKMCEGNLSDYHDLLVACFTDLPSAQRWIPCSERLPKQGQEVICQCRANMIKVLKLDADGDWYQDAEHCYMSGFVIAWMPLPAAYREGGNA